MIISPSFLKQPDNFMMFYPVNCFFKVADTLILTPGIFGLASRLIPSKCFIFLGVHQSFVSPTSACNSMETIHIHSSD